MADFELEQHFLFPEVKIYDVDNYSKFSYISEKTKRDEYFYIQNNDCYQDNFGMLEL